MVTSDINKLPHHFFQPALSSRVEGHTSGLACDRLGQLVTDIDDVHQCIHIILSTPLGSNPHRPLFGSRLHLYLDYPVDSARPHIVREVVDALHAWEPRIAVIKVTVNLVDVAALACVVQWQFAAGVDEASFVTNLALGTAK